jgi:hypothetical protein
MIVVKTSINLAAIVDFPHVYHLLAASLCHFFGQALRHKRFESGFHDVHLVS